MDHNRRVLSRCDGCLVQIQIPASNYWLHLFKWCGLGSRGLQNVRLTDLSINNQEWRILCKSNH